MKLKLNSVFSSALAPLLFALSIGSAPVRAQDVTITISEDDFNILYTVCDALYNDEIPDSALDELTEAEEDTLNLMCELFSDGTVSQTEYSSLITYYTEISTEFSYFETTLETYNISVETYEEYSSIEEYQSEETFEESEEYFEESEETFEESEEYFEESEEYFEESEEDFEESEEDFDESEDEGDDF